VKSHDIWSPPLPKAKTRWSDLFRTVLADKQGHKQTQSGDSMVRNPYS
jgi:hypothetical protein